MAPLIDGLIDNEHDLILLHLALSTPTHMNRAAQSIVRPPVFTRVSSHRFLNVPLIRAPWALSLFTALQKHLGLYLFTLGLPLPLPLDQVRAIASTSPRNRSFHQLQRSFYFPVGTAAERRNNAEVLGAVRKHCGPAIHKIATGVKLSFLTEVLQSLRAEHERLAQRLQTIRMREAARGPRIQGQTRGVKRRRGIRIRANLLSDGMYMLHGHRLERRLLEVVSNVLEERVGISVEAEEPSAVSGNGSLASLSNRGTVALQAQNVIVPKTWNVLYEGKMDSYLRHRFGLDWSHVVEEAVRIALSRTDREELESLPGAVEQLSYKIELGERLREELVERAVAHELGGAKLSRICAFKIAQADDQGQVDDFLKKFSDEYLEEVEEARKTLKNIENGHVEHCVYALPLDWTSMALD